MGDETRGINRNEWVVRGCEAVEKYSEVCGGFGCCDQTAYSSWGSGHNSLASHILAIV